MPCVQLRRLLLACLGVALLAEGLDDGLARTPPMGWRNWNAFEGDISQDLMQRAMDAMVRKGPNGLSLRDVGYTDAGLDDFWQACGAGDRGGYHDKKGTPIVNTSLFPNLTSMVAHGHKLNLTVGWYLNNCKCGESGLSDAEVDLHQRGDVRATLGYGFDSLKLDGCGPELNLTRWVELFRAASPNKPIMIENCHWGGDLATPDWCPYHFARSSSDVTTGKGTADWGHVWGNMQTMSWANDLARPGCWNYPDMLETGNFMAEGQRPSEDRATFGMWAIVSSPLILSYDLEDQARNERVWDLITNRNVIAVNQAWAGDAGRLVYSWDPNDGDQSSFLWSSPCDMFDESQSGWFFNASTRQLTFNLGDDPTLDQCLDMQPDLEPSFARLTFCSSPRRKRLMYNEAGLIVDADNQSMCLTPNGFMWSSGPGLTLQECANFTDHSKRGAQHFSVGVAARGNHVKHQNIYCLSSRTSAPLNSNAVQLWAKKIRGRGREDGAFDRLTGPEHLPHLRRLLALQDGEEPAQAVLVVNADQASTNTLVFSDAVLRKIFGSDAPGASEGALHVSAYDLWRDESVPSAAGSPLSVRVGPRDSAFYLLRLSSAAVHAGSPETATGERVIAV